MALYDLRFRGKHLHWENTKICRLLSVCNKHHFWYELKQLLNSIIIRYHYAVKYIFIRYIQIDQTVTRMISLFSLHVCMLYQYCFTKIYVLNLVHLEYACKLYTTMFALPWFTWKKKYKCCIFISRSSQEIMMLIIMLMNLHGYKQN